MNANSLIQQAELRELELGRYLITSYSGKLKEFEKKYHLKTNSFIKLFESGKTENEQEFFEWFALFKGKQHWEEKLAKLQEV